MWSNESILVSVECVCCDYLWWLHSEQMFTKCKSLRDEICGCVRAMCTCLVRIVVDGSWCLGLGYLLIPHILSCLSLLLHKYRQNGAMGAFVDGWISMFYACGSPTSHRCYDTPNTCKYSISQKLVHPSHFCKYFIISFHVTTLKKSHFTTM